MENRQYLRSTATAATVYIASSHGHTASSRGLRMFEVQCCCNLLAAFTFTRIRYRPGKSPVADIIHHEGGGDEGLAYQKKTSLLVITDISIFKIT